MEVAFYLYYPSPSQLEELSTKRDPSEGFYPTGKRRVREPQWASPLWTFSLCYWGPPSLHWVKSSQAKSSWWSFPGSPLLHLSRSGAITAGEMLPVEVPAAAVPQAFWNATAPYHWWDHSCHHSATSGSQVIGYDLLSLGLCCCCSAAQP